MGTSYGLYNGRWVLDCGECGRVGGVRRRRCPARGPTGTPYCPPSQLCATCYATWRRDGRWAAAHATCQRDSNAYHAREAAKNAEPHRWAASA